MNTFDKGSFCSDDFDNMYGICFVLDDLLILSVYVLSLFLIIITDASKRKILNKKILDRKYDLANKIMIISRVSIICSFFWKFANIELHEI